MGRKGVSKRKPPKSKNQPVSTGSTKNPVSALALASESTQSQSINNGEAISIVRGGKKKSTDAQQTNKKR
jgi:hypothetical protein